jgi:putative acetyltransferase
MTATPGPVPVLRREQAGEEQAVRALVDEAFGHPVVGELVDSLRRSDAGVDGQSYVAEVGGDLAGHVMFTRSLLDAPPRLVDVLVLSPLSVRPSHQGNGLGTALARWALEQVAQSRPEPLVFLEGSPAFYPRLGFRPAGPLGFRRPSLRIPEAAFMVAPMPSYEPWMTGTLVYAETFWRHDCVGLRDPS